MNRQRRFYFLAALCLLVLFSQFAWADAYDPPAGYYTTATGVGTALKQQLHALIDAVDDPGISDVVAISLSYDSARANLQVSDADVAHPGHMITVYDRSSLDVSSLSASGIPGWDPSVWNREHTWPRSRGVGSSGPDDSDMFEIRPALSASNGDRADLNFGGAFARRRSAPW